MPDSFSPHPELVEGLVAVLQQKRRRENPGAFS
jgi:hypothetical protein